VAFQYLKGAYKQEGERLFTWVDSGRTSQLTREIEVFHSEGGDALEQVAHVTGLSLDLSP